MAEEAREGEQKKEYIVDGFLFLSAEDAAAAREELKKAKYLKRHLNSQTVTTILEIYRKAIEDRTFQTPVGLAFVNELRERLIEEGIEEFDIEPIPVYYDVVQNKMREGYAKKEENEEKPRKEMGKLGVSVVFNVILGLLVAGMFYVAMTGNNPNILNYEKAVVNKYAAWEQELQEREQAVKEKERSLSSDEE